MLGALKPSGSRGMLHVGGSEGLSGNLPIRKRSLSGAEAGDGAGAKCGLGESIGAEGLAFCAGMARGMKASIAATAGNSATDTNLLTTFRPMDIPQYSRRCAPIWAVTPERAKKMARRSGPFCFRHCVSSSGEMLQVQLPLQGAHICNHCINVLRRKTMPEAGFIDLHWRHDTGALIDQLSQLRV